MRDNTQYSTTLPAMVHLLTTSPCTMAFRGVGTSQCHIRCLFWKTAPRISTSMGKSPHATSLPSPLVSDPLGFGNEKGHITVRHNQAAHEHIVVVEVDCRGDERHKKLNQETPQPLAAVATDVHLDLILNGKLPEVITKHPGHPCQVLAKKKM